MNQTNSEQTSETITVTVEQQENGQYLCHLSPSLGDRPREEIRCYGQGKEHAIAIALEKLAADYRRMAEEGQNIDWLEVQLDESGKPIEKLYHVILHYERTIEAKSKFEAMHHTIMGNTAIEDAKIFPIAIDPDLPIEESLREDEFS